MAIRNDYKGDSDNECIDNLNSINNVPDDMVVN